MFEQKDIGELKKNINLSKLHEIAKISSQIGNKILKKNYNNIQKICHAIGDRRLESCVD